MKPYQRRWQNPTHKSMKTEQVLRMMDRVKAAEAEAFHYKSVAGHMATKLVEIYHLHLEFTSKKGEEQSMRMYLNNVDDMLNKKNFIEKTDMEDQVEYATNQIREITRKERSPRMTNMEAALSEAERRRYGVSDTDLRLAE